MAHYLTVPLLVLMVCGEYRRMQHEASSFKRALQRQNISKAQVTLIGAMIIAPITYYSVELVTKLTAVS